MTDSSASAAPTPPESASTAEDFIDIFVSPSKVFARRAKASPMVPFLTVWIVLSALFFAGMGALRPVIDAEIQTKMEQQMKTNPQITPDAIEKMKPMMRTVTTVGGVIGVPIAMLIVALVLWVVGRFILGGMFGYGTALMITAFSWFPKIIEGVINLCQGLLLDVSKMTSHYQMTLGLARFLDPATTSPKLMILAGQLDVFSIWTIALCVLGLIYAGKVEKTNAIIAGVIIWLIPAIPAIWA